MQIINIPSFFLLYSAISFFTSILLQSLFHGRKDASANLWIWSCLLSAIATFGTVFREYVPPLIGYTLMVALETVAMLLQSTSLTNLYKNNKSIFPPSGIYLLIIFLFVQYVLIYVGEGKVTPLMSAFTAVSWMLVSFYNTRSSLKVVKIFENNYFIKFLMYLFFVIGLLYAIRTFNIVIGYAYLAFDQKLYNIIVYFCIFIFGTTRNVLYLPLRMHLAYSEHSRP